MRQGNLFDTIPELRFFDRVLENCRKIAKQRYPLPMGEDKEEYAELLQTESRLEFCEHLRKIADEIEKNTLKRQTETIRDRLKYENAIE